MFSFSGSIKVFLAVEPCDLRKGFQGLQALVSELLQEELRSGAMFVFCNRRRTRLKVLHWDGTGLWLMIKRLEQGTFNWPKGIDVTNGKLQLSAEALTLLLDGVDLRRGSFRPWYQR